MTWFTLLPPELLVYAGAAIAAIVGFFTYGASKNAKGKRNWNMSTQKTKQGAKLLDGMRSAKGGILAFLLLTGCAGMMAIGAGCSAYAAERLKRPALGTDSLSIWVADLDDRMTGSCRR